MWVILLFLQEILSKEQDLALFSKFLAIPVNITFFFQLQVAAKAGEEIKLQVSYRNELFAALNVNF